MKRSRDAITERNLRWYGSVWIELLALALASLPAGLGVGYASGQQLASLITSLAITGTIYLLLKADFTFIHPHFHRLPPNRQVLIESVSGFAEHILGACLAFFVSNRLLGSFLKGDMAWYMVIGSIAGSIAVHAISYTLYSHLELKERVIREEQLRAMTVQAELKALKAQINPHFLFNTLNTIAQLIHADPLQAEATVERLAQMFRYVLAGSERGLASLEQELAFVDDYLEIERARFGERLCVARQIAPQILDIAVPGLILQPLVENAIQHGQQADGRVNLTIHASRQADEVIIAIADQGPGMPPNYRLRQSQSFGLRSVDERLRKSYGENYPLQINANNPQGTVVTVRIPLCVWEMARRNENANANTDR